MSGERFYVTPSRISRALECGLKYRRQFVEKLEVTSKPGLPLFAGDMQHRAIEAWSGGAELLEAHTAAWFENGPPGLVVGNTGKDSEQQRHYSPLGLYLHYDAEVVKIAGAEEALEARILEQRPDLKKVRASKEWKDEAPKLDPKGARVNLEKTLALVDGWFRAGKSPWRATGPNPLEAFAADRLALVRLLAWWLRFSDDERPDIVHTEAKERIELEGGTNGFTLTGVIDAVYLWPDGSVEVVDYKRSRGKEDPVAHFVQAAAYAETCRKVIGLDPSFVTFHHLSEGERLRFTVEPDWTPRLVELAERVERMHVTNDFAPSFRTCSWCDYVDLCRTQFSFIAEVVQTNPVQEAA